MAYRIGRGVVVAVGLLLVGCQASVQGEAHAAAGDGADEQTQAGDAEQAVAPGALPTSLSCNHGRIRLGEGTYAGNLVVGGNHCLVEGAGRGKTIIEGSLSLSGNHNSVRGVSVRGPSKISGNHNDASGAELAPPIELSGNHNRN